MSLLAILGKGGLMMYIILIAAIWGLAIIIERLFFLKKMNIDEQEFMAKIKGYLRKSDIEAALKYCKNHVAPISDLIMVGLTKYRLNKSKEEIKEAIENRGNESIFLLEKRLGMLGTLAAITPLLGFLGTVTGMIKAFMEIQAKGGNVDASVLAGGIWEALLTTAAGLSVGIPILLMYNYFTSKIERFVYEMEKSSNQLIDILEDGEV